MTKAKLQENRKKREELMARHENMFQSYSKLSETEKASFHEWDASRPEGVPTSDWPGWEKYVGKRPYRKK